MSKVANEEDGASAERTVNELSVVEADDPIVTFPDEEETVMFFPAVMAETPVKFQVHKLAEEEVMLIPTLPEVANVPPK